MSEARIGLEMIDQYLPQEDTQPASHNKLTKATALGVGAAVAVPAGMVAIDALKPANAYAVEVEADVESGSTSDVTVGHAEGRQIGTGAFAAQGAEAPQSVDEVNAFVEAAQDGIAEDIADAMAGSSNEETDSASTREAEVAQYLEVQDAYNQGLITEIEYHNQLESVVNSHRFGPELEGETGEEKFASFVDRQRANPAMQAQLMLRLTHPEYDIREHDERYEEMRRGLEEALASNDEQRVQTMTDIETAFEGSTVSLARRTVNGASLYASDQAGTAGQDFFEFGPRMRYNVEIMTITLADGRELHYLSECGGQDFMIFETEETPEEQTTTTTVPEQGTTTTTEVTDTTPEGDDSSETEDDDDETEDDDDDDDEQVPPYVRPETDEEDDEEEDDKHDDGQIADTDEAGEDGTAQPETIGLGDADGDGVIDGHDPDIIDEGTGYHPDDPRHPDNQETEEPVAGDAGEELEDSEVGGEPIEAEEPADLPVEDATPEGGDGDPTDDDEVIEGQVPVPPVAPVAPAAPAPAPPAPAPNQAESAAPDEVIGAQAVPAPAEAPATEEITS